MVDAEALTADLWLALLKGWQYFSWGGRHGYGHGGGDEEGEYCDELHGESSRQW